MTTISEWTKTTFQPGQEIEINKIFRLAIKHDASDIHLQVGRPPVFRVKGTLRELQMDAIPEEQMIDLCFAMMDQRNLDIFHHDGGADFSKVVDDDDGDPWRFRVNLMTQLGMVGMVARKIERFIPPFEKLYLPPIMESLCKYDQGMVLLAGVTGSGKSTTIASMLDWINHNYRKHILTIEDPIEFVYTSDKCLINQREIGQDVIDFSVSMKHAVREDPDIILVGEMRDLETIELALEAASTGHLVFGTLHTQSAAKTIDRIIDVFPAHQQAQIRTTLSETLKGVVAQNLFKRIDKKARMAVLEVLVVTPAVSNLIREGKTFQIPSAIQTGKKFGMQSLDDAILQALEARKIGAEDAFEKAIVKERFIQFLKKPPEFI
ncbi:MAG: PilT/PilU family type 4a pilus ATPase [Nitrospinae bacterium]|nr:PilT/PilU family type 4a pilus ATPase [Nitrospinota bacterium]